MQSQSAQEEAKLMAMQRVWHSKRGLSSLLLEDMVETEQLLSVPQNNLQNTPKPQLAPSEDDTPCCKDEETESLAWAKLQEQEIAVTKERKPKPAAITLDASNVGDFPARYTICALDEHQLPVVGVYVDKRVIPGFKYRVRPLPEINGSSTRNKCLFNGRALTLKSIGRGYARRFTFDADKNKLNDNTNYFWSDNRPEGYSFELEVVSEGDKFTIFDADKEAQGTLEILKIDAPQIEISNILGMQSIEKRANVKFTGKVEFFETGVAKPTPLQGVAIAIKYRHKATAEISKILNVIIRRQRYTLLPGIQKVHRRVTVRGQDIHDVPTKYSMTGLEPYELPVVGTYVDPRIIPGFYYKVRPNDRKEHLFNGRALKLESVGMGYAKRLTFAPDSLLAPDNYLWSDNHPDGIGLEIRAIRKGMAFTIRADDAVIGEASVFRADAPQIETQMEKVATAHNSYAIEKRILIDVMCHVRITGPEKLMRVCGMALVRKEPNSAEGRVVRVERVGFDSQLKVLFAQKQIELTFHPKN